MRRIKRGGADRRQDHHINETWVLKPLDDAQAQEPNLDSSSLPSTAYQEPKSPNSRRNPKSVSLGRRKSTFKKRFVEKSELNSSISQLGSFNAEVGCSKSELNFVNNEAGSSNFDEKGNAKLENKVKDELESKEEENGGAIEQREPGNGVDDIARHLEGLWLAVEEPELSEEQLRINDQLQEDELLVIESIYGDNIFILDRQKGLRSFQILINVEAADELTVTAKLNSFGDLKMTSKGEDDYVYSFKVQYLRPIVLTCLLPKSYPSQLPPYFTISVQWLDCGRISNLCSMLDSIWTDQLGQEVLYQWTEWLQNSSLSFLGIDKEIMLGPYGIKHTGDTRAVSGSVSPGVDIPSMRNYNDKQQHESFLKNLHECSICYNEYAGPDFIRLPCLHFYCWKCMKTYSNMHVAEGTVNKLQCPDAKCGGMVPPSLLKQLLSNEEYERWESLMIQKTLESMSDVVYCPRCETPCIEDEDQHAQCSKCFFSFCTLCNERRHVGEACVTPELRLKVLEERQNSSRLNSEQRRKEREMINEILSIKEILRDAMQCPSCKMAISRTEGCNKMVCSNCGRYFCYRCNKQIDGYDHFKGGSCELFPTETIMQWEARMNARQVVGQIQAEHFADNGHPCPNCGQPNVKIGNNNHIFCWACQNHYCYLCRMNVRRSSQHYGPKGCKQHTLG